MRRGSKPHADATVENTDIPRSTNITPTPLPHSTNNPPQSISPSKTLTHTAGRDVGQQVPGLRLQLRGVPCRVRRHLPLHQRQGVYRLHCSILYTWGGVVSADEEDDLHDVDRLFPQRCQTKRDSTHLHTCNLSLSRHRHNQIQHPKTGAGHLRARGAEGRGHQGAWMDGLMCLDV